MLARWWMLGLAGCTGAVEGSWPDVRINEVMAANVSAWADPDAACVEHDDWVELFNPGTTAVDLTGWTLVDDAERPLTFGDVTLAPGGRLVVAADEQPDQGPLHAPFGLDARGEWVALRASDGREVDRLAFPGLAEDQSWGPLGDGATVVGAQRRPTPGASNVAMPDDPCLAPPAGFDDHTAPCLGSVASFDAWAAGRAGLQVVKLSITDFQDPNARAVAFLDSAFYDLHDEWYIFRMLNGQAVPGEVTYAPYPGAFTSIDEIYDWARAVDLGAMFSTDFLRWAGERLTSSAFYKLALGETRILGLGVITRIPARPEVGWNEERWALELEYSDAITATDLQIYFDELAPVLPPGVGAELLWLVRAPAHERLAEELVATQHPLAARLIRYADLTVPGEVQVYHPGLTAGRVRRVRSGEPGLAASTADDLLVLEDIPDELPPAAALFTAVPQTPLAHVALLAESRGIPNAYVAGIVDDPEWDQWARIRAWVAVRATGEGLDAVALSGAQIAQWRALAAPILPAAPVVDEASLPYTVPLDTLDADDMPEWRARFGGKNAGMLALLDVGVSTPDTPLAVTVRAYREHVDALGWMPEILALPAFARPGDARARYLILEGSAAYDARYPGAGDQAARSAYLLGWPAGTPAGDLARGRGVRGAIEAAPIPEPARASVAAALSARFAALAPTQGLRFRSSSNLEDLEGFNGAGLYGSYSGWLDPDAAGEDAAVDDALRQAWASYWGAEAFEERHAIGFAHLEGGMGVMVHPRFDDEMERSNGVITMTRLPDGHDVRWRMIANNQVGALSVTNPETDTCAVILPEVVEVTATETGAPRIIRRSASTETDGPVLDDTKLLALFDDTRAVTVRWLEVENARVAAPLRRSTLTLDFEYREMAPGWPAMADGSVRAGGVVLKQARTLEPSSARMPELALQTDFPRDVLARASQVERVRCDADRFALIVDELRTDPLLTPDFGYAETPFVASAELILTDDVAGIGLAGDRFRWDHTALFGVARGGAGWEIAFETDEFGTFSYAAEGAWAIGDVAGASGTCTFETLYASPDTWLDDLITDALAARAR